MKTGIVLGYIWILVPQLMFSYSYSLSLPAHISRSFIIGSLSHMHGLLVVSIFPSRTIPIPHLPSPSPNPFYIRSYIHSTYLKRSVYLIPAYIPYIHPSVADLRVALARHGPFLSYRLVSPLLSVVYIPHSSFSLSLVRLYIAVSCGTEAH